MNVHGNLLTAALRKIALLLAVSLLLSCSPYIGFGVVSWSIPDHGLSAGDVVPVYIQSNIGKVYVIGAGSERENRIEVPLWQINLYKSRSRAKKAAAAIEPYRFTYATARIDGLPIRAKPENTARQVYRLRLDEIIRIVRKGTGTPVLAGNAPLDGDWYNVLTNDGTTGWCFSYNLSLYDEREKTPEVATEDEEGSDHGKQILVGSMWYPDHYRTMLNQNRIDIDRIQPQWGFFPGEESSIARIATAAGIQTFPYTAIIKTGERAYQFEGTTLTAEIRRGNSLVVQYTDDRGMPDVLYFSTLDIPPDQLIEMERTRRHEVLDSIRTAGPRFVSGNYGVLQFLENDRFLWSGYQLLTPSIIPAGAGGSGIAEIRWFLSDDLAERYTGVLTFRFDSTASRVNFLYELSSSGLKLEQIDNSNSKDSLVIARNLNPTVIFLTPETAQADGGF